MANDLMKNFPLAYCVKRNGKKYTLELTGVVKKYHRYL